MQSSEINLNGTTYNNKLALLININYVKTIVYDSIMSKKSSNVVEKYYSSLRTLEFYC